MLSMFIMLWVLIALEAPIWCFIFLGLAATSKIVSITVRLIK